MVALLAVAFLGLAAPSPAAPGSPGLTQATEGVYVGTNTDFGRSEIGSETGSGSGSGSGAAGSGLPFTGFIAPALLAVGLAAIALGLGTRTVVRQ